MALNASDFFLCFTKRDLLVALVVIGATATVISTIAKVCICLHSTSSTLHFLLGVINFASEARNLMFKASIGNPELRYDLKALFAFFLSSSQLLLHRLNFRLCGT